MAAFSSRRGRESMKLGTKDFRKRNSPSSFDWFGDLADYIGGIFG
jgi:hypothetical protein